MTKFPLAFALMVAAATAVAQGYPTKPVTMIVPFPPGGVADIVGRPLAAEMEKVWKQPVVVTNRTGAGGAVGMAAAAKAAPDGYTILMALSSVSIFPVSDRIQGRAPAYEMKDLAPIALITADPTVLIVGADSPWKTLQEFVASAKAYPGQINYSSSGVYGTLHVAMEMFANAAGVKLFHVPYQGGGPALTALLGGQVHALASGPAPAAAQMKAGKVRALASWSSERLPLLPEIPTFKELGYDAEFYIWSGVFAPAATPTPVLDRLRAVVREAANSPEFKSTMEKVQTPVSYLDAPAFRTYWERDAARLKVALEKIGKVAEK
ncbi:MAG TPA: tripartite tricarboxylate transporter substrate binding protein [Burkholderiales bacterium]